MRLLKITFKILLSILIICFVSFFGLLIALQHPKCQQKLKQTLISHIKKETQLDLNYSKCSITFPFVLCFENLKLEGQQMSLSIEKAQGSMSLSSLCPFFKTKAYLQLHQIEGKLSASDQIFCLDNCYGSVLCKDAQYELTVSLEHHNNSLDIEGFVDASQSEIEGFGIVMHHQIGSIYWKSSFDTQDIEVNLRHENPSLFSTNLKASASGVESFWHLGKHRGHFSTPLNLFANDGKAPINLTLDERDFSGVLEFDLEHKQCSLTSDFGYFDYNEKQIEIWIPSFIYDKVALKQIFFQASLNHPSFPLTLECEVDLQKCPPFLFKGNGFIEKKQLHLSGTCKDRYSLDTKVSLLLPLQTPFSYTLDLYGKGDFSSLGSFLEQENICVSGSFSADLHLQMKQSTPLLYGTIDVDQGQLHFLNSGTSFYEVKATAWAKGNQIDINLQGSDQKKHPIELKGSLLFSKEEHFPFYLESSLTNFLSYHSDVTSIQADGIVILQGDLNHLHIEGKGSLKEGTIDIGKRSLDAVPDISFITNLPKKPSLSLHYPITWSLNLQIPETLLIKGKGLKSLWKGSLGLTYTDAWRFTGKLKLTEGHIQWQDERICLTYGKLHFNNTSYTEGLCEIIGTLTYPSLTITTRVAGSVVDPSISFDSTPRLPQEKILAWLLFGSDINEITPKEMVELTSILNMRDTGFKTLKKYLGVDLLTLTSGHLTPEYGVTIGKYLNDRTFIALNKSLSGNDDTLTFRGQLFKDLFLEGSCSGKLNQWDFDRGLLSLKWHKSY